MSRPIVVPLDGSALAEHALVPAIVFARKLRSDIHLIRVQGGDDWEPDYLPGIASRIDEEFGGNVVQIHARGGVSDAIIDYAREVDAVMIVMGTRYHDGLQHSVLSSVAQRVARRAGVPVLLTGSETTPVRRQSDWAIRRVLVPLDGSDRARQIIEPVARMAAATGARMTLLRVIPLVPVEVGYPPVPLGAPLEPVAHQRDALLELEEVAQPLRQRGISVDTRVVQTVLSTAHAIINEMVDTRADMIAMVTRGHGLTRRLAFGSVAHELVRKAQCPMLVLSPSEVGAVEEELPGTREPALQN